MIDSVKTPTSIRTIHLPAIDRQVTLAAYVKAVKLARANPSMEFKHGLTTWWSTSGSDIMRQFLSGVHDRINQSIPYSARGAKPLTP